ncbi:D-2-hydroxyacid dehydrogenase [Microbacterium halophytorum]|uniref:D-2-hydroxyacid dehydrogenase n=1 Tax=Microbacterium halophytorum TaxID=2067568 RepID=UPI000CFCADE3|nr:D-2-hydroxyacid dehydrogenase [Microbacterium halophytorum]
MPEPGENRIGTVLSSLLWNDEEIASLRDAIGAEEFIQVHPRESALVAEALERAEVAILPIDLDDRFLRAPKLRWVHCDHAGLTKSARPEVLDSGLIVTGSAGRSAEALAQHAFYFALGLAFDARGLHRMQDQHVWQGIPGYQDRLSLAGQTLGIVGLGHTGTAMADLGKAFGMRVLGYRRTQGEAPPSVDRMYAAEGGDSVDDLLAESDVVMLAVSLSDETHHLIGAEQLARMRPNATLINLARGAVVDQDALIDALRSGRIAGAGLDVTTPEPLPADSPLWDMPNVVITPHMTPKLPDRTQRSIDIIAENARRYRRGEPLRNAMTRRDLYTLG